MSESEKNILDAFFESKTRTKIPPPKAESLSTPKQQQQQPTSTPAEKKKDASGGGWAEFERKAAPASSLKGVPLVKNLREVKVDATEESLDGSEAPLDTQKKVVWNPNKPEKGPQVSKKLFPTLQDSLTITTTTERAKPKDKEKEKEKEKEKPKEKVLPKFVTPAPLDFKQKNIYDEIEEAPQEVVIESKAKTEKKKKGKGDEKETATKVEPASETTPFENHDTTSAETDTNEESEKSSTKSKKKKKGKAQSTSEATLVENQETTITETDTSTPTGTPSIDSTTTEKGTQKKAGKKQEKKPVQDEVDKLMQEMGLADEKKKSTKKKGK